MIRVGTCGFPVRRELIFRTLDAVELQDTFYSMPDFERIRKLRAEAPEGFHFSVKVFQGITHSASSPTMKRAKNFIPSERVGMLRPTKENLELWDRFRKEVLVLSPVLYVFQSPPSFGSEEDLRNAYEFFRSVQGDGRIGWEPRGKAYENLKLLIKIFEELNVVHIVDPFRRKPFYVSSPMYFRLHGKGSGEVNYSYNYTDSDLLQLYEMIKGYDNSYVMFNNIKMFENAKIFKEKFVS
ncbi:MAG: DUF72 domain-containing protein [Nitrososphaeria archaeon]